MDANDSYHSLPGDRPNGDNYRDIPHIDDGRYTQRGDDPYHDARPLNENPYGRATMPDDSHHHTPTGNVDVDGKRQGIYIVVGFLLL